MKLSQPYEDYSDGGEWEPLTWGEAFTLYGWAIGGVATFAAFVYWLITLIW